jgi:putative hydrolase of the HAD superfamily
MPSADAAAIDAVTIDGFGTLLELADPTEALQRALARHGVVRDEAAVRAAFLAEVAHYRPRSLSGYDDASLLDLRTECVQVFLAEAQAGIDPGSFVADFVTAIVFRPIAGAVDALDRLRAAGLELACVANWDVSLNGHLDELALSHRFGAIVSSAEARVEKPDPRIFEIALEKLGVPASRALHIGDEAVDRDGAQVAGLFFEPTPLATLPERLGL